MPNWLKISLFLLVLAMVGIGAMVALAMRELPPAANVDFIQASIAEDLQELRAIAQDSREQDLEFDISGLVFGGDDDVTKEDNRAALDRQLAALDLLDDRVEAIDNPLIVFVSLYQKVGGGLDHYSVKINSGDFIGGGSPFSSEPTLGNPVVSRVIGGSRNVVRYAELVSADDELEVGVELYLDMDLLQQKYDEQHSM